MCAELSKMESLHHSMRAMLNGMIGRKPQEALNLSKTLPEPRPLWADDAQLIAAAVDANPELAALAREIASRQDALELARMQFIPDINPLAAFTGSLSQSVGAMVILPTTIPVDHIRPAG